MEKIFKAKGMPKQMLLVAIDTEKSMINSFDEATDDDLKKLHFKIYISNNAKRNTPEKMRMITGENFVIVQSKTHG